MHINCKIIYRDYTDYESSGPKITRYMVLPLIHYAQDDGKVNYMLCDINKDLLPDVVSVRDNGSTLNIRMLNSVAACSTAKAMSM